MRAWTRFVVWDEAITARGAHAINEAEDALANAGGYALFLFIMALIYVGIPAFLLAAFLKLVVVIYGVLPL